MKSDLQLKARDKLVQKMTRDGVVEENLGAKTQKKISRRIAEESLEKETVGDEEMELGKGAEKPVSRFQAYKKQMVYRSADKLSETKLQETAKKEARPHSTPFIRDSTGSANVKAEKVVKVETAHKHKLHKKQTQQFSKKQKLHFAENSGEKLSEIAEAEIRNKAAENRDDNAAVEAVQGSETTVEHGVKVYSRHKKRTAYKKQKQKVSHLLHEETEKGASSPLYESRQKGSVQYGKSRLQGKRLKDKPVQAQKKAQAKLNQKNRLKKDYAAAFRANTSENRYSL